MARFIKSKGFAVILLALATFSVLFFTMQVTLWESHLLPHYPVSTLNNISGLNFFTYFTVLSNALCTLWMLLYGIGKLLNEKLAAVFSRPEIQGALTVYIFIVGFLYWAVMVWFIDFYPKSLWMFNIVDFYQHLIIPSTFTLMWIVGMQKSKVNIKRTAPLFLVYPLIYFIFSIIRGNFINWYPYPFFNAENLWETLFSGTPINLTVSYILVALCCAALIAIIFALSVVALRYNNKRAEKLPSLTDSQIITESETITESLTEAKCD